MFRRKSRKDLPKKHKLSDKSAKYNRFGQVILNKSGDPNVRGAEA